MRSHAPWVATVLSTLLVVALALDACASATSSASPSATRVATPSSTATGLGARRATVAWTAFAGDEAIQVWIAAPDAPPRLLATLTNPATCQTVAAGLPMLSPDGAHVLVSLGKRCNLILDPGPLLIVDVADGRHSVVPLPDEATVLPQVRSYGWVDNRTLFAFSPKYNLEAAYRTYLYTLGAGQAETLTGLTAPLEGVVRGSTLFYLETTSGAGGIQSILRRYDLAQRAAIAGGIDLGAYASCSECPDMVISPGWDVAADGGHVVFQRTTPSASGGIASSQILSATAEGGHVLHIAQSLATDGMAHLRLSPDGKRVAITGAYPTPAVLTACVDTPGTRGDPCFATYRPDALSLAAWFPDGRSFLAATVDGSYGRPPVTQAGSLVRYTLGSAAGQPVAAGYGPWSAP
jgi:hypothetical protein